MELHIKDRIYIPQILPQQNSFKSFNIKRDILKKIALTESDREEYEIKEDSENSRIVWNVDKDRECPLIVEFSKDEVEYIKNACESLTDETYPDDLWVSVEKFYDESNL